jgi:hypothetical protein
VAAALGVAKLRALRTSLLPLHKALLDAERARYEQAHGRIESAQDALRLVMSDPWFAWLAPLAALIVQIDERLADATPVEAAEVAAHLDQAMALLRQGAGRNGFRVQYERALQESADVVVAHGQLAALLRDRTPAPTARHRDHVEDE